MQKKEVLSFSTEKSDCIGKKIQSLFAELGVPVTFISHKDNDYYYKAYFGIVNTAQLLSLERVFKGVNFVLSSEYSNISLTADIDGVKNATFAVTLQKNNRNFVKLDDVSDILEPNEYFLGIDEQTGEVVKNNLLDCPHLLIAGASGSGKSVLLHNIIASFLDKKDFDNVTFALIDMKKVEFERYKAERYAADICQDIATDIASATRLLAVACKTIDSRYKAMAEKGLTTYEGTKIVVIIDEFADLISRNSSYIENYIVKISQLGRACGVHLILATQRPSASVCSGLIKANFPCRIAFKSASKIDSRIIIGDSGAELLRGKGECLYRNPQGNLQRLQCFL